MNKCNVLNDSIVVTGAAGFIGFHLSCKLIKEGFPVIGVDNINSYYDVSLKEARLNFQATLGKSSNLQPLLLLQLHPIY